MNPASNSGHSLPHYSKAEEMLNTISHGLGILMGIYILIRCILKASAQNSTSLSAVILYGITMIILYSASTCYHALPPSSAKSKFRMIDHCTIYLLIAGTYTPIVVAAILPNKPLAGILILVIEWGVSLLAILLNIWDLKRFRAFSYTAYIVLGWCIAFFAPIAIPLISRQGLLFLLYGGISYTFGAILFAIGSKKPWFHSAFHFFVLLGSYLQFVAIYQFIL